MRAPDFWYSAPGIIARLLPWLLAPFAMSYLMAGWLRRCATKPHRAPIPVICVGNLTLGGTGKTPLALALAKQLQAMGVQAHFLTRGYGGRLAGPVRVEAQQHRPPDVGDEALLLAAAAPCWVARNRKAGAMAAVNAGAEVLILDDGYQNPQLCKDLSLLLIGAERGFGNGWVLPSGPLREPVASGIARADAVMIIGDGGYFPDSGKPQYRARRRLREADAVRGKRLYAFCGIGAPEQFFTLLRQAGGDVAGTRIFSDHHPFTENEIAQILEGAKKANAAPVTTEKDWVRLSPAARRHITAIGMEMRFDDEAAIQRLLEKLLGKRA